MTQKTDTQVLKKSREIVGVVSDIEIEIPPQFVAEQIAPPTSPTLRPIKDYPYIKITSYVLYYCQRLVLMGIVKNIIIDSERDDITVAIQGKTDNYYYYSLNEKTCNQKADARIHFASFIKNIVKEETNS